MSFEMPLFGSGLAIEFDFRDGDSPDSTAMEKWQQTLERQAREEFGSEFQTTPENVVLDVTLQPGAVRYYAWLSIPSILHFRSSRNIESDVQLFSRQISTVWGRVRRKAIDFIGSRHALKDLNAHEIRGSMDELVRRFTQGKIDVPGFAVECLDLSGQYDTSKTHDVDHGAMERARDYLSLVEEEARAEMTVTDKIREGATEMAVGVSDVLKQLWKNARDNLAQDLESETEAEEKPTRS